jgi:hypothetical protein
VRRFLIAFSLVSCVALLTGAVLGIFLVGGKSFVGFPFPIVRWPRSLPPIPGASPHDGALDFSGWALMLDVGLWALLAAPISRRARRK